MKTIIATEQIFSPLGHRTGLRYHYEDGSSREINESSHTPEEVASTLKKIIDKCNVSKCKK